MNELDLQRRKAKRQAAEANGKGDAWEGPAESGGAKPAPSLAFRFNVLDSAAFAAAEYPRRWLIQRVLVKDQPAVAGGPRKALKTSLFVVDMAVSLGTATPFLGEFQVYNPVRVAVLSGESGPGTIQDIARRVCFARGVELADAGVLWGFQLPQLSSVLDVDELRRGLEQHRVEVAIVDPLYLCLLAGQTDQRLQASSLFDMGPLLYRIAQACLSVGCTPILLHHSIKRLANPCEPLELEDLAFAGIQEFARQWLLLNRREPFEPDTGVHRLWLSVGGSVGHSGLWAVDVDEGVLRDDFGGRKWEATVRTGRAEREGAAEIRETMKEQVQQLKDRTDDAKVLQAIDKLTKDAGEGEEAAFPTKNQVRLHAHMSGDRTGLALGRLIDEGVVDEAEVKIRSGRGHRSFSTTIGYRRKGPSNDRTDRITTPFDGQSGDMHD